MSEQTPVQEPVVTPEPPKEFRYEFQPVDESGNPLGGKQVVVYNGTPEDLGNKMAENNSRLIALNRKLKKDLHLSGAVKDTIPESAPRFDESKYMLQAQPLTAEERMQLAADINDPEKFDAVSQRLVRATIGDPEALRTRLARLEQQQARVAVQEEAKAFMRDCPEYYPCQDNLTTIAAWIEKNNLDPIKENFQLAFSTLKEYLQQKPAPAPVVQPAVSVQPEPQPTPAPRPVSSGLTRTHASDSGPAPKTGYTDAEINEMSGEEYRQKVLIPEFKAKRQQGRA